MDAHLTTCPKSVIKCKYSEFGCDHEVNKWNLKFISNLWTFTRIEMFLQCIRNALVFFRVMSLYFYQTLSRRFAHLWQNHYQSNFLLVQWKFCICLSSYYYKHSPTISVYFTSPQKWFCSVKVIWWKIIWKKAWKITWICQWRKFPDWKW